MIVAENLVYHIQGRRLTDDVSLTLPEGEIIAILGPNGAGKSTLLRQLTGYLQPHSGRCSLFGKPLNEWSITELAKTRAVMRQNSHMAFPFSVQEVIRMGRHPYRTRNTGDETEHIMTLCDCRAGRARLPASVGRRTTAGTAGTSAGSALGARTCAQMVVSR